MKVITMFKKLFLLTLIAYGSSFGASSSTTTTTTTITDTYTHAYEDPRSLVNNTIRYIGKNGNAVSEGRLNILPDELKVEVIKQG